MIIARIAMRDKNLVDYNDYKFDYEIDDTIP
jgi:hypothetical protein